MKYPIGIQSFQKLREEGFVYVDKTRFIIPLINNPGYYFLSRPRRFGKSLLLSTLQAFFEGRRDLFKGLDIDSANVDWIPSPVIHFDLNSENFQKENGLENLLESLLEEYETNYDLKVTDKTPARRFATLIKRIFEKTGRKVVILVDEYDKPLLGLEDNKELFESNQATMKGFFGNLKSMDAYIRFAFLTGVARFNKVSIFSDLNNLNDISLSNRYADICGWTENELTKSFREGIKDLAEKRGENFGTTVDALRNYYDGYLFAEEGNRLYNPFSVLLALSHQKIEPYWFGTGTPSFLAKRVKEFGIGFFNLEGETRSADDLLAVGTGMSNPIGLMFQTGYLTIDSYEDELQEYTLRFPNREVEIGFARQLLTLYAPQMNDDTRNFSISEFRRDLVIGEPKKFMERLQALLKNITYGKKSEDFYQNFIYMLCLVSGTEAEPERQSYIGRSDLEVKTRNYIYIFEFKYNGSAEEALKQIKERDYSGRFVLDSRTVFLIGANFSDNGKKRGLDEWIIEEINRQIN